MAIVLHYYPGHNPRTIKSGTYRNGGAYAIVTDGTTIGGGLLVVLKDGKEVANIEAWGGPSKKIVTDGMPQLPTPSGKYVIGRIEHYYTPSWGWSKIKWGTPIKDSPLEKNLPKDKKTDVWYKLPGGENKWASVKDNIGLTREAIVDRNLVLYGVEEVPKTWIFNDFGPLAIRYFKDLNNNKKLDKNERLDGTMFHTTPENEAETVAQKKDKKRKVVLENSHGCIHLKPNDRTMLIKMGAFKEGNDLVIHPYNERYIKSQ